MNLSTNFEQWLFSPDVFNDAYFSGDEDDQNSRGSVDRDEFETVRSERSKGRTRGYKARYDHIDRINSYIYSIYLSERAKARNVRDPESSLGKEFRRKFRVPYSVFEEIVRDIRFEVQWSHKTLVACCCSRSKGSRCSVLQLGASCRYPAPVCTLYSN